MSRAVYFIAVGSLGLLLDGILRHNDNFSPFCVYGFNLNSQPVLFFVRDGLFSKPLSFNNNYIFSCSISLVFANSFYSGLDATI